MSDDLERTLREAFDAQARAAVGDSDAPPPPRFAAAPAPRRNRTRLLAPLAAAAAVLAVVGSVLAVRSDHGGSPVAGRSAAPVRTSSASATGSGPAGPTAPVRIRLLNAEGARYGVGMPVIALFSRPFTNAAALSAATTVTVDGRPARGAWYFEHSASRAGYPVEGHLRLRDYWPAHASIHVDVRARHASAGPGLAFADDLTLDFVTGAADVAVVDARSHRMTVTRDGRPYGTFPVSLGAHSTPTSRGTKVIMEKGASICMSGPGYQECGIRYTQRLTYSGEYLHAAPWNVAHIRSGIDSSNGCTNLLPADAARLYAALEVGDVVRYPNASGPPMSLGEGYGDWNVPWSTWLTGGLVPTS